MGDETFRITPLMRCDMCKHWTPPDPRAPWQGWGTCQRASSTDGEPDDKASFAVAQDAESYTAYLETAPNFGCVMYEAKETP